MIRHYLQLKAKDGTNIEINEISTEGIPVTVVLDPAAETEVTFTVDDTMIASVFEDPEIEPGVGKSVGAGDSPTVVVTTDAETGEATAYVYGNNEGTTTLTASTDDGLSVKFNITVDVEDFSEPDESSEEDNSEDSSDVNSESQGDSSSNSSSSSKGSSSAAGGNDSGASDTNPATGAAAGAAAAVILVAMGTIVASRKSKD